MSIFDGMEGDLGGELDDLDSVDLGADLGADLGGAAVEAPGAHIPLPDPFGTSPLSPETEGVLDATEGLIADASASYARVAAAEGLAPDLPAPGAEQADAFIDAAMNADAGQAARMMAFEQGQTYVQDVANDIAEKQAEVQQAEETSAAIADAELRAAEAERVASEAASEVARSQRERGV
jgi:hypothetical protein